MDWRDMNQLEDKRIRLSMNSFLLKLLEEK